MDKPTVDLNDYGTERSTANGGELRITELDNLTICERSFDVPILIDKMKIDATDSIQFKNCTLSELTVRNTHCKSLEIWSCEVSSLTFFDVSIERIIISNSNVKRIRIGSSARHELSELKILSSQVQEVAIDRTKVETLNISSAETVVDAIRFIRESPLEKLTLAGEIGSIALGALPQIDTDRSFSIGKVKVEKLDLRGLAQQARRAFLTKGEASRGQLRRISKLLVALYDSFMDRGLYHEMDKCLLQIRRVDCMLHMKGTRGINLRNFASKTMYLLKYAIVGVVFGWGINLRNSIISSLASIIAFSFIQYYLNLNQDSDANYVNALFESLSEFASFLDINLATAPSFHIIVHLFGLIFITVTTGVLLRKIIR